MTGSGTGSGDSSGTGQGGDAAAGRDAGRQVERLPLFPLGTVLFPGLVLPLRVFEERYRLLVRHLLEQPSETPRRFGVVAIELGHEVGQGAARSLAAIGCTAEVQEITPREDGRFDLLTSGGRRFRINAVDDSEPYLRADVTWLPDEAGPYAAPLAAGVTSLFRRYCQRLRAADVAVSVPRELPTDPVRLSYLVAAGVLLDRTDRQRLLEADDAATRLLREHDLLRRETTLLGALPALPAADLLQHEQGSPN